MCWCSKGSSLRERLTRRRFLEVAGVGAAGAAVLGATGCGSFAGDLPQVPDEYLPKGGPKMNVVVVIVDSLRRDHVGAYGNRWIKTPSLDALAKESLLFTRPYPESIPTIPARRAIHTGVRTWPFRDWHPVSDDSFKPYGWAPVPEDQAVLAEVLSAEGINTNTVTDNLHMFRASYDFQRGFDTFDYIRGQERDQYRPIMSVSDARVEKVTVAGNIPDIQEKMRQYLANTSYRKAEDDWFAPRVFTGAGDYLEQIREAQPFFLLVDSFDPHEPWDPPRKYVDLYGDPDYSGREPTAPNYSDASWITEEELKRMRALYAGDVTMTDAWLGRFLNRMEDLGLMKNTLLVVLSDHGACLGEHNDTGKPYWALYPELTDTVFMMRHPQGKGAGETSEYYASTHDVAPTILSMLGIEKPQQMEGADLSPIFDGGEPDQKRDHFTLGYNNYVWARDDKYVMFSTNTRAEAKLYDVSQDPGMHKDLAAKRPDMVKRMFDDYVLKDAGGPLPNY
jgi:arylsulfatase A-like enzyme